MAANTVAVSRTLFEALRPVRTRPVCKCLQAEAARRQRNSQRRNVSTAPAQYREMEVERSIPRWAQTPPAMKAPFTVKNMRSVGGRHDVNKDPKRLDDMYVRFMGRDGPKLLSEETKWLAITHKSFDHGRRGFNDRLAFLGKRIVELQASLGLLSVSDSSSALEGTTDIFGREPFSHPAVDAVECLSEESRSALTHHKRVARVAEEYGIPDVMRWVPRNTNSLSASGADMVYAQAVFAIIGGLALEQGGAVANRVVKERLLQQLGVGQRKRVEGQ